MKYIYLYQDKNNVNQRGELQARSRNDAYLILRKQGIRPYRVIGDDPWNWRPWAVGAGYAVLIIALLVMIGIVVRTTRQAAEKHVDTLPPEEAEIFRAKAIEAVYRAPEACRYYVWKGVNARLAEHGIAPIEKPVGVQEDDDGLETP